MPAATQDLEQYRRRLTGIAYRILGSMTEAEDVVQEAYLRWHRQEEREIRIPEAWLTTVLTRLCIDRTRVLARERESYSGPWLPEPVSQDRSVEPERRAEITDDLSIGLLLLLQNLSVEERVAFVLRQGFDYEYAEIARILEKREDACRQLVHRATVAVRSGRPKHPVTREQHEYLLRRFLTAMESGDERAVLTLIAPDATWTADGGGKARGASTQILRGDAVARMAAGLARKMHGAVNRRIVQLAGQPAIAFWYEDRIYAVWTVEVDGDRIRAFNNILNPDKLTRVEETA